MKLDFAFLCDYADVTGKINAMGIGFEMIYATRLPAKNRLFFLVAQFRVSSVEAGQKRLTVNLIDEDGKDIIAPTQGSLNVPRPGNATESTARIAMEFNNVEFAKYGSYSLHLLVDGTEMAYLPFKVAPPPAPPQPQ